MWRSYYDHRPVKLFGELTELLRTPSGFPFWRSVPGAFYAARSLELEFYGRPMDDFANMPQRVPMRCCCAMCARNRVALAR
jgi:hypothetical protein